ncbi:MAG: hypothetical protein HC822_28285 [Oscillochloris sp.]|nr:hypothetical protein [Oscillochloris sp.]
MKIVLRTLIILAAALVVVGGLSVFAQTSFGRNMAVAGSDRHEGGRPEGFAGREGFFTSDRADGFAGHEHSEHGPSLFGLVEVAKNLAIVAVSVILIALGTRLLRLDNRNPRHFHEEHIK